MSVCRLCRERIENSEVCGIERHVRDEIFAELDGAAFGINFKQLGGQILSELTGDSHDLSGG